MGLFPIKKVDKDAIVPINVISLKLFQHFFTPPNVANFSFLRIVTKFCILVPRKPMSEN